MFYSEEDRRATSTIPVPTEIVEALTGEYMKAIAPGCLTDEEGTESLMDESDFRRAGTRPQSHTSMDV